MTSVAQVAWLSLGSNLEAPAEQLARALDELAAERGLSVLATSSFYRTTPVGGPPGQPDFCNACVALATWHGPYALLAITQAIEQAHGRVRDVRWGPRTLDIDMLAFDDVVLSDPVLSLPHPRAAERGFVLVPLAEIAPALVLAGHGRVADLARRVGDAGVQRWQAA
jgi:2-amino-4-hydroxy-6-hydroxymethyldihydropteridine diphosphokinase